MSSFGNLLGGSGMSPRWLKEFQKGKPGDAGIYIGVGQKHEQRKLYGPILSPAHASVLSALTQNKPGAWPEPHSGSARSTAFGSRYDAAELRDLVEQPEGYYYTSVKLLPVTKLKLAMSEAEALQNLRAINMTVSRWFHFFGFAEPADDDMLFPFVRDEES